MAWNKQGVSKVFFKTVPEVVVSTTCAPDWDRPEGKDGHIEFSACGKISSLILLYAGDGLVSLCPRQESSQSSSFPKYLLDQGSSTQLLAPMRQWPRTKRWNFPPSLK